MTHDEMRAKADAATLEDFARKFIVPLGYPADADWKRIFVGNIADDHNTGSLFNLCMDLARAATDYPRVGIDREKRAIALLEQFEAEGGQWVAVRVENEGWEIVRPRTQKALKEACDTDEPPLLADLAAKDARLAVMREAATAVVDACDRGRMIPKHGAGGMTIEANIRGSQYNGVDAWPVEELRSALADQPTGDGE